jgi:uncharacterized protein (TIGR03437 family)
LFGNLLKIWYIRPMRVLGVLGILALAIAGSAQSPSPAPQTVWFGPQDPALRTWSEISGSVDYMDLFSPTAPWGIAASHVQVFKVYASVFISSYLPNSLSDDNIRQMLADIARRHMALAVEWGPLVAQDGCGAGVEGFTGDAALTLATRIRDLGGNLQYIVMDEPFWRAGLYASETKPITCFWAPETVAANAVQQIKIVRGVFPNVIVGDTERAPATGYNPKWLTLYQVWFDAWRAAYGKPLAFFQTDVDRGYPNWRDQVEATRQALVQRGISFGMIYNGLLSDQTDAGWTQNATNLFLDYELHGGVIPDQAVFQSWDNYPKHVLPESDPTTLTHVIDLYIRQRTDLVLTAAPGQVNGGLSDSGGHPILSVPITLELQPTSGSGVVSTYTMAGTVPASINQAVIQICINQCDGSSSTNDVSLYSFHYHDSGQDLLMDSWKDQGNWKAAANGTASVQISSDVNGAALTVYATPDQHTFLNSPTLAVTPGSAFTLTIQARISPYSTGSGVFALTFLVGDKVSSRVTLPFATGSVLLSAAQTGSDGSFGMPLPVQKTEGFQVQASYSGTDALWPAFATASHAATSSLDTNGVMNAADFKVEPMSPGAWFSVFGRNLGGYGQWTTLNTFTLGGASITVCGSPAVIAYNSGPVRGSDGTERWQLNALLPDVVAGHTSCPVIVTVNGQVTQPSTISIATGIMELFAFSTAAGLLPILTHLDYSLVGPGSAGSVPAQPGETVVAWGTGDCQSPQITVGGIAATVVFSGVTAPGLCQLNFKVPQGLSGANPLAISTSPNAYTLWLTP